MIRANLKLLLLVLCLPTSETSLLSSFVFVLLCFASYFPWKQLSHPCSFITNGFVLLNWNLGSDKGMWGNNSYNLNIITCLPFSYASISKHQAHCYPWPYSHFEQSWPLSRHLPGFTYSFLGKLCLPSFILQNSSLALLSFQHSILQRSPRKQMPSSTLLSLHCWVTTELRRNRT